MENEKFEYEQDIIRDSEELVEEIIAEYGEASAPDEEAPKNLLLPILLTNPATPPLTGHRKQSL